MKKPFILVLLSTILLFSFCGCCLLYDYELYAIDSFNIGYTKLLKDAYVGDYNWDGSDEGKTIIIPETYGNCTISALGGYSGRGYPSAFQIIPTEDARNILCPNATEWSYVSSTQNIEPNSVQYLRFKVHISKYISDINELNAGGIILAEFIEGEETKNNVYVLICYVTCDEENKHFYAKDGKLYFKENDMLVDDIFYEDFVLEQHNETHKDEPVVAIPFARK